MQVSGYITFNRPKPLSLSKRIRSAVNGLGNRLMLTVSGPLGSQPAYGSIPPWMSQPKVTQPTHSPQPQDKDTADTPTSDEKKVEDQAKADATKEEIKEETKNKDKFEALVEGSSKVILNIKTSNWFDLFPNELIIDVLKVNAIYHQFLGSDEVRSILIKDISGVVLDSSPFGSTLTVHNSQFKDEPIVLKNLSTDQATQARRIIQGLVITHEQKIDLTSFTSEELKEKLEELGKARDLIKDQDK